MLTMSAHTAIQCERSQCAHMLCYLVPYLLLPCRKVIKTQVAEMLEQEDWESVTALTPAFSEDWLDGWCATWRGSRTREKAGGKVRKPCLFSSMPDRP